MSDNETEIAELRRKVSILTEENRPDCFAGYTVDSVLLTKLSWENADD